jgi:trans-aconitate methyltransferase
MHTFLYRLHFSVPPFGRWQRTNHASVASALPVEDVRRVLEVGGGLGQLAALLARRYPDGDVLSIDISDEMHRLAEARNSAANVRFACRDFLDMDGQYDLIVSAGCWEFLPLEESADAVARLLVPGGTLVVNTLLPTLFARIHGRLYKRRYHMRTTLHEPESLVEALGRRGIRSEWVRVNRVEGSYTLVGRSEAASPSPARA